MLALVLASALAQAPVDAPAATPPSAAEWAARVDRKLLSFVLEPMPVVRSRERRMEVGGLFSFSDELEQVLAEVPEAAITYQGAQRSLRMGTFLALGAGGAGLTAVGLLVGALLAAGQTAIIVLGVSAGVAALAAVALGLVALNFAQNATRGLMLALEQYNHGLLAVPPQAASAQPGGLVVQRF